MHEFIFQARGASFSPGAMTLGFAQAFEPNTIATFGGNQGNVVRYGAARYVVPTGLPQSGRESDLGVALDHLAALLPAFRHAGATEFILHIHRRFEAQCNEEFTRDELRRLVALDCHLFYQARHAGASEA